MAAHVFDATEPTLGSARDPVARDSGSANAAAATNGAMFASQPAVFQRMHQRSKVGAGPVIGLLVGAVLVGGVIYASSRHNQGANGATTGIHTTSQPPAMTAAAAKPAPSPMTGEANPAPAAPAHGQAAPQHLRIVAAPPRPAAPVRAARPVTHVRAAARVAPAPAPERAAVNAPAPMAITPAPQPAAPPAATIAPAPAPEAAPATAAPAPAPAPAPDAGSATPQ